MALSEKLNAKAARLIGRAVFVLIWGISHLFEMINGIGGLL